MEELSAHSHEERKIVPSPKNIFATYDLQPSDALQVTDELCA